MTDALAAIIARSKTTARTCRGCGCTDDHACQGGCHWVLLDVNSPTGVCSTCGELLEWRPEFLEEIGISIGFDDLFGPGEAVG